MKTIYKTKLVLLAIALAIFSGTVYSQTTYTFNYTGNTQTLSLPAGTYSIQSWGGDGYTQTAGFNGRGGFSSGVLTLTIGQIVYINVGGVGGYPSISVTANAWTFNGGGIGYPASNALYGNGGGASDVRTVGGTWDNPASLAGRVIVAGGGGAGRNASYIGGNGGGLTGGTGTYFTPDQPGGPTGGSQIAGGTNTGYTSGLTQATLGLAMTWNGNALTANFLAGGGGGYYGGGSGRVAGGGGSSYIGGVSSGTTIMFGQPGFVSNPVAASGNGYVIITQLCNISLGTTSGITSICQGAAVTLTTDAISSYTWSNGSNAASILVSPAVTTTYSLTAMSPSNCITSAALTISVSSAAPVLTITASSPSVCLGNTVSISAVGALTYTFSGGISNGVAFTPTATTIYTIVGQNGCGTSTSLTTISIAPLPVVGIASPTLVCAGNSAILSGGGATTYTWLPGNIVGNNVGVSPQVNTTYTVIGGTGNCIGINTVNIATNPNPTLTVSSTHFSLCAGESATLTATGAIGYTWTPGGVGASIVVSPIAPTGYNVIGVNSFSCYASSNIPVIAYAGPNMNIAASTTLVCTGGSVSLNASGASTYSWSTGAITPVTVINPVSSAVYTVVGSTPNSPCATTKTIQVDVFTATISVSSPTAICLGESTTLNASGATTYNWSNGGSGSNVLVSPVSTTGYTVNGISTVGGTSCSSTGTTMVTVNPLPTVTASSTRTNICRFEFANIIGGGASTYSWSNASTASSISVNPNTNTTYTVIGTDANGCKGTASIQIKVFQCVGISENSAEANLIQIYPNPSSGEFSISAEENMSLILANELGQLISELELNAENNYTVQVKNLAKGVYFISSKNSDVQLNKKVIVQ